MCAGRKEGRGSARVSAGIVGSREGASVASEPLCSEELVFSEGGMERGGVMRGLCCSTELKVTDEHVERRVERGEAGSKAFEAMTGNIPTCLECPDQFIVCTCVY